MRGMNQRQGGYSYSGSQGGPRQVKHVSIKREPEPELKKSENPWMPSKLDSKATESTEEAQTAVCFLRVIVLNWLLCCYFLVRKSFCMVTALCLVSQRLCIISNIVTYFFF